MLHQPRSKPCAPDNRLDVCELAHAVALSSRPRRAYIQGSSPNSLSSLADEVRAAEDALTCMLDSLSETCEMDALRLRKAMERRAKVIGTLGTIRTKIGKTEDGIVKNLK